MRIYFHTYRKSKWSFQFYHYRGIWRFWKLGITVDYSSIVKFIRGLKSRGRRRYKTWAPGQGNQVTHSTGIENEEVTRN
jgi:hypothetical protein